MVGRYLTQSVIMLGCSALNVHFQAERTLQHDFPALYIHLAFSRSSLLNSWIHFKIIIFLPSCYPKYSLQNTSKHLKYMGVLKVMIMTMIIPKLVEESRSS